jgi:formylglycine-generating enzyme required for sulfatase activity
MDTKTLGDYTIIKPLGQGSLGAVLLAEHKFMKRQFALKMLPQELSQDRQFIHRFEEEVGALSQLDHPHIVKIHNVSFAQGTYFLVTDCIVDEHAETTNLAQYIHGRGQRLEEKEVEGVLKQIADALDYAHQKKNLVHRGLKLNNVLVGKSKGAIQVYLSDFGLSRIVGTGLLLSRTYRSVAESLGVSLASVSHDSQKLASLTHSFLQSYLFLAPEQKRLDPNVSLKADTFAFGVLAYWLLTGDFPEGIFEMPTQRNSALQPFWDTLVRSCLHLKPELRADQLTSLMSTHERVFQEYKVPEPEVALAGAALKPVIHTPRLERPNTDIDPAASLIVDTSVKKYVPEKKVVDEILPIETPMVIIPGGEFFRGSVDGSRDEMPRHKITLPSFAIDIHPVTNEQFVRFLEAMGGEKDTNHNDIIRLKESRIKRSAGKVLIESGYSKHPVVGVTWYGAVAYAKWVGKRLPREAEWEIAAAEGLAPFPTGDDIEKSQANFFSSDTTAVMSYAPNPRGLYDMAGNVYEWVHDWYGYNYYEQSIQEPTNPQGPIQGVYRVLRGGCWKSLKEDLRCSRRHRNNPGTVNSTYGFRCAADVE